MPHDLSHGRWAVVEQFGPWQPRMFQITDSTALYLFDKYNTRAPKASVMACFGDRRDAQSLHDKIVGLYDEVRRRQQVEMAAGRVQLEKLLAPYG